MTITRSLLILTLTLRSSALPAAQLEVIDVAGTTLRDNPLGDPARRRVAVFTPDSSSARQELSLVIYLPGWGGSSEDAIAQGRQAWFGQVVDELAARTPLRIAIVDGRSRYGGSQFLNSTATGRYADYVAEEIWTALTTRYAMTKDRCIIAGHSSGGYGALVLAMNHQARFNAVVALSPDSDFEVTHKPLVEQASVRAVTPAELEAAMSPKNPRLPQDGLAGLIIGLCANYAPVEGQPARFEWLYDAGGRWRAVAWQRWLALDPLTLVRKNVNAFAPAQRIYLDGAEHDEFGANIGARKISEVLQARQSPATFHESPGHHGDQLAERLVRGLEWGLQ